jgi:hypothetical protein
MIAWWPEATRQTTIACGDAQRPIEKKRKCEQ